MKYIYNKIINHDGFRRYFFNTSWMFGEQVLRLISGLFVGVWVARYLGPEQFGVFSYALAFVSIFSSVAKLGLDNIVVRNLVYEPNKKHEYLGTAFWLKFFGAIIVLLLISIAALIAPNNHETNLYIFIIASGIVFQSFEVIDFYFRSQVLAKFVSGCKIIQLVVSSILKIYLVLIGADLFSFVVVSLIDQFTLGLTLFIAYFWKKLGNFYFTFDLKIANTLLRDSWPLIFSGVVVAIYMRIDQIMISAMLGNKEVGIYSAAVRLSEVWYFIPTIIANSFLPAIVNAKKISKELYHLRLQRLFILVVWLAIAIAVPMTFLSDWLINVLYGELYQESGQVLAIHIWTGIFVFLGVASSSWFTAENLQKLAFSRTFIGAILNIVLNIFLIPHYGIVGAAIATLLAQITAALAFDFFTTTTRAIFFMKLKAFNLIKLVQKVL